MKPDDLKQVWQTQSSLARLSIDADLLLAEVRRNQWYFTAMIFWRDVREVGICLVLAPLFLYLAVKDALPWTAYLTVLALVWIAGFMLLDRLRQRRHAAEPSEPLRARAESSLAQVEHQIWLLRNVHWWYLLPIALAMLAFFGQVTWQERSGGWWTALAATLVAILLVAVLSGVYWINQVAVRSTLEPRRQELETLLASLKDETPTEKKLEL
jgi:hypothetical protein